MTNSTRDRADALFTSTVGDHHWIVRLDCHRLTFEDPERGWARDGSRTLVDAVVDVGAAVQRAFSVAAMTVVGAIVSANLVGPVWPGFEDPWLALPIVDVDACLEVPELGDVAADDGTDNDSTDDEPADDETDGDPRRRRSTRARETRRAA